MTDAPPLASEQITQEDREAAASNIKRRLVWQHGGEQQWMDASTASMRMGEQDDHDEVQAFARHRIAALSATPAPSDQDASRAQGEVERLVDAARAVVSDYPVAAGAYPDLEGGDEKPGYGSIRRLSETLATLSPAPGATAQDGVDADTLNLRAERAAGNIPSPTPTIPAGMVAYGPEHPDYPNEPKDWNKGALLFNDGKLFAAPAGHIWKLDWKHHGIIAYTPLAAAPKQAEQQGVERKHSSHVTRASDASSYDEVCVNCGATDIAGGGWGQLAGPCAALNAPTGAVETGEAM